MFLVVLGHVLNNMGLFTHPVNLWLHQFHMPFFFMLSGFLAVRTLKKKLYISLKTKLITLMLPFIACGGTYALTFGTMTDFIYTEAHAGRLLVPFIIIHLLAYLFTISHCFEAIPI